MSYADAYTTQPEKLVSGALALATHMLFFVLLVFGVSWQKRQVQEAVIVDLWNNLPPVAVPKAEEPQPRPEAKPAAPEAKPAPKVEAKPAPKIERKIAPKPEVAKPDIALREKREKERKLKEDARKKEEAAKRAQEEQRLAMVKEQQRKEEEAQRLAREQAEALKRLQEQQAAAQAKLIDEYKRRISERIRRFIVEPPNLPRTAEAEFDIILLPGGDVLGVKLRKSSAIPAYDNAVERAIRKAQPLPLPPDPALFRDFRELNLKIRPKQ